MGTEDTILKSNRQIEEEDDMAAAGVEREEIAEQHHVEDEAGKAIKGPVVPNPGHYGCAAGHVLAAEVRFYGVAL